MLIAFSPMAFFFIAFYGETLGLSCWDDFARKRLDREAADKLNDSLAGSWPDMRERIKAISLTPEYLADVLNAAGGPVTPEAIHLERPFYDLALLRCREIRNRYTFLDLAANSGELQPALAEL